jgi:hypothetical protein
MHLETTVYTDCTIFSLYFMCKQRPCWWRIVKNVSATIW